MALSPPYIEYRFKHNLITLALSLSIIEVSVNRLIAVPYLQLYSSSLSRDPLGYVRLVTYAWLRTLGYQYYAWLWDNVASSKIYYLDVLNQSLQDGKYVRSSTRFKLSRESS